MPGMKTLTLTRPDDWHLHLRDDALMHSVLPDTARQFARAIVMPNLRPPVDHHGTGAAYRERILSALARGVQVRTADDAVPDRQHQCGRDTQRQSRAASCMR